MKKRLGFTLVELLVVIAIIGVLVALLLPAVQYARESARRIQCANHLKQLGIGFHLHHDVLRSLPHAGIDYWVNTPRFINGAGATGDKQWAGWGYQVLPYIEQQQIFDGAGATAPTDDARRILAISTPISVMYCPSRRPAKALYPIGSWYPVNPNAAQLGPAGVSFGHGAIDYASAYVDGGGRNDIRYTVVGGANRSGAVVQLGGVMAGSGTTGENEPNPAKANLPVVGLGELSDGMSNVIVLGEKRLNISVIGQYQTDDNEGYTCGWDHDVNRNCSLQPRPDPRSGYGELRFGSSHPTGFQVLMGDGAVKFIPYVIDELIFHRLGYKNDGQVAGPPSQ